MPIPVRRLPLTTVPWLPAAACLVAVAGGVVAGSAQTRLPAAVAREAWLPPLAAPLHVSRAFEPPSGPYSPGHRGVDLVGTPGELVRSASGGVVDFSGVVAGRGVVSIQTAGRRSTYEPVRPLVTTGRHVQAGDPVAQLLPGHLGCPARACLHWGVLANDSYIDPMRLLGVRVRLLPLTAREQRDARVVPAPTDRMKETGDLQAPTDRPGPATGHAARRVVEGAAAGSGVAVALVLRARRRRGRGATC